MFAAFNVLCFQANIFKYQGVKNPLWWLVGTNIIEIDTENSQSQVEVNIGKLRKFDKTSSFNGASLRWSSLISFHIVSYLVASLYQKNKGVDLN